MRVRARVLFLLLLLVVTCFGSVEVYRLGRDKHLVLQNSDKVTMMTIVKAYLVVFYIFLLASVLCMILLLAVKSCWSYGSEPCCIFGVPLFPEESCSRLRNGLCVWVCACFFFFCWW